MNKNELYNLMTEKKSLTEEEINSSLKGNASIDSTKLDEFDREALEGWKQSGLSKVDVSRVSNRLGFSKSNKLWLAGSVSLLTVAALFFWFFQADTTSNKIAKNIEASKYIEQTDIYLEPKFDTLIETAAFTKREITRLQKTQNAKPIVTVSIPESASIYEIDKLPIKEIEIPKGKTEVKISNRRKIKEVYLYTFKLVDYRAIRSKPSVATKQMDLTGTSANLENSEQKTDEVVWKDVEVPYIDYIDKTMYLMEKGSLKKAMARFDVILETYPDDINALFYAGFSLYNLKEYEKAQIRFSEVLQNYITNFDEEAAWYLALSYEKIGQMAQAKEMFATISESESFYADMAKKKLTK